MYTNFNPRTPLQSATAVLVDGDHLIAQFQSTHSITECDSNDLVTSNRERRYFNPRTPLQSATTLVSASSLMSTLFQSTHSITECDVVTSASLRLNRNFNPRTPLQSATCLV